MEHRVTVSLQIARHVTSRTRTLAQTGIKRVLQNTSSLRKKWGSGFAVLAWRHRRRRAEFSSFKYFLLPLRLFNSSGCDFCSLHWRPIHLKATYGILNTLTRDSTQIMIIIISALRNILSLPREKGDSAFCLFPCF